MDRISNEQVKKSLRYFKALLQERFHITHMILFGSRARDDWLYSSDIDLILVSDDFRSYGFLDRMREIAEMWDGDLMIEAICYTPEEFERKRREKGIVNTAMGYGIEI